MRGTVVFSHLTRRDRNLKTVLARVVPPGCLHNNTTCWQATTGNNYRCRDAGRHIPCCRECLSCWQRTRYYHRLLIRVRDTKFSFRTPLQKCTAVIAWLTLWRRKRLGSGHLPKRRVRRVTWIPKNAQRRLPDSTLGMETAAELFGNRLPGKEHHRTVWTYAKYIILW